tara:strand:+ start:4907 stop:6016 length:1110 start_codon:yes stop_codon:yes gene_type:complete
MLASFPETATAASRVLYLNSKDGQTIFNGNRSNFQFTLEEPIVVPDHHTILASVISAEIPYSFYNFQDGINTQLDYQTTGFGVPANYGAAVIDKFDVVGQLNIAEGNYNAIELANLITFGIPELLVQYDVNQLKFNFQCIVPGTRVTLGLRNGQSTGTPQNPGNDMNEELGFDWFNAIGDPYFGLNAASNQWEFGYTNSNPGVVGPGLDIPGLLPVPSPTATVQPLIADDVADTANSIRSLFLRSNLSSSSVLDSHIGGGFSNILTRVPIDVNPGEIINIKPADGDVHKLLIKQKVITEITMRLTNQKNTDISLNGLDYDVSIKLEFIETKKLKRGPLNVRDQIQEELTNRKLKQEIKIPKNKNKSNTK